MNILSTRLLVRAKEALGPRMLFFRDKRTFALFADPYTVVVLLHWFVTHRTIHLLVFLLNCYLGD